MCTHRASVKGLCGNDVRLLSNAIRLSGNDTRHVCTVAKLIGVWFVRNGVVAQNTASLELDVVDINAGIEDVCPHAFSGLIVVRVVYESAVQRDRLALAGHVT